MRLESLTMQCNLEKIRSPKVSHSALAFPVGHDYMLPRARVLPHRAQGRSGCRCRRSGCCILLKPGWGSSSRCGWGLWGYRLSEERQEVCACLSGIANDCRVVEVLRNASNVPLRPRREAAASPPVKKALPAGVLICCALDNPSPGKSPKQRNPCMCLHLGINAPHPRSPPSVCSALKPHLALLL